MATDLVTVARNTSVEELHRLLVDEGLRLVPVVERDVLVGTVTRNDLLRTFLPRPSPDADAQKGDRRRAAH
jgi:CBS domain-containing protein